MKINWGHKIILVFALFVGLIATLVYKSVHTNFELVTKEYYKDELVYQQVIDGKNNANKLAGITTVTSDQQYVHITLPGEMKNQELKGNIWFYCAANANKDRRFQLTPDASGKQAFNKNDFLTGEYLVKVQWEKNDGQQFYSEQYLTLK
jgi:hypothetical protein